MRREQRFQAPTRKRKMIANRAVGHPDDRGNFPAIQISVVMQRDERALSRRQLPKGAQHVNADQYVGQR